VFLRKSFNKSTGRTYLSIIHGFRDKDGKSKSKVIESIGYVDELSKEYDDPIAHFTKVAEAMSEEHKITKKITITIDMDKEIDRNGINRKNYGYIVFSKIYHELEIDRYLDNARRNENFKFNTEAIMRMLIFTRLLYSGSKRASFLNKDLFFENFDFSLYDVYEALTHFNKISSGMQQHLHERVSEQYDRNTKLVYYDVTNYYFEIDKEDELRKKGVSKENRKDPIVQMGLMIDSKRLPITYQIFPGNTHDSQTLIPMLTEIKKKFKVGRIVVVADKGLNCGDNIAYNTILEDGYIYSKSVRGGSNEFKEWVLGEAGYIEIKDKNNEIKYKKKSKIVPDAVINVTIDKEGNKNKKKQMKVEQKWIVFYSEKYAKRAKEKREEAIEKAKKMIKNPAKYRSTFDHGAAGYIKNLKIDKDTGEIINIEDTLELDIKKIEEEEKYDGYNAIATSELDDSDENIIDTYRGLWQIEDSFKVTKSILGTRPIYVRREDRINAHFLTCFISLLIARIVEMRLGGKYTIEKITETLEKVECSHIEQNLWLFDYVDEVTDDINRVFGIDFNKKVMELKKIKENIGKTKIRQKTQQL